MKEGQNTFVTLIKSLIPMLLAVSVQLLVSLFAEIIVIMVLVFSNIELLTLTLEHEGMDGVTARIALIYSDFFYNSIYQDVLTFVIMAVLALVFGLWFFHSKASQGMAPIQKALVPRNIALIAVAGVFVQIGMSMMLTVTLPLFPAIMEQYTHLMENLNGQNTIFSVVAVSLLAPFAEELIFRGLTLRGTRIHWKSFALVNFLQALYFGIYHMNIVQGIYAFIMGLVFGYVAYKLNNVFASILFHASVNSSSYLMGLLPNSIFNSIIGVLLIAVISFAIVWALMVLLKEPEISPEPLPTAASYAAFVQGTFAEDSIDNVNFTAPVQEPDIIGHLPETEQIQDTVEKPESAQDENKESIQ